MKEFTRADAHDMVDLTFRELLPAQGMAVREAQISLSHTILDAMLGNHIALCDAGTGIGKTYAYLVAGIAYQKYRKHNDFTDRPVIISTSSISLQEAIIHDYLPLLSKVYIEEKDPEDQNLIGRIEKLTANDFYNFCAMGYRANNYSGGELSPKEWYLRHADGRDEGLREIDPDSTEAFNDWFFDRDRRGGHPWEVCRGGNSTHVSLGVHHDEKGYYLILAGSAWTRCIETIRFYLALREAGVPVILLEGRQLLARMLEEDKIGIVPNGIWPAYCESLFPGERILDFINLPNEKKDAVVKCCTWFQEPLVTLAEEDPQS